MTIELLQLEQHNKQNDWILQPQCFFGSIKFILLVAKPIIFNVIPHANTVMIFEFLESNSIPYNRVDHAPVFTCEEAKRLVPQLDGVETKNLFLRDAKGRKHFLLSVPSEKNVDLKALSTSLGINGLSFASPERLKKYLDLDPGAVTLLGVINDTSKEVEVLIDEDLWNSKTLLCHPLVNTSTLSISKDGLVRFFELTEHAPKIISVPARNVV